MKYILIILLVLTTTFCFAQEFESSGMDSIRAFYHGYCRTVEVSGDYAYYSAGKYLHISDISDPFNTEEITEIPLAAEIIESVKDGDYIYYSLEDYGFCVLDVSDPALPEIVSYELSDYSILSIHISDTIAFISAGSDGMFILNIADPYDVEEIAHYTYESCYVNCIDNHGDYAYISDFGTGLKVIDISDLTAPVEVGFCIYFRTAWVVYDDGIVYMNKLNDIIITVDVSDPTSPELLDVENYDDWGWRPIMDIDENTLFIADSSIHVFDISTPSSITEQSIYHIYGDASDIHVIGDLAYVADYYGMAILDISDIDSISCLSYSYTVLVLNNMFCYENNIFGWTNLYTGSQRIDVTEPFAPKADTFYNLIYSSEVLIDSSIAFTSGYSGFSTWDLTDLESPVLLYGPDGGYIPFAIIDDTALMNTSRNLYVLDISDPLVPSVIDSFEFVDEIEMCVLKDSLIFAASNNFLYIYSTDDSYEITELSRVAISNPFDITLYRNNLILSYNNSSTRDGYGVVDFSDPASPEYFFNPDFDLYPLEMIGTIGIDFRVHGELRLLDFSDLHAPVELANFRSNYVVNYIRNGTFLFVTLDLYLGGFTSRNTLYVLDISSYFEETTYEISRGWNLISYPFEGERALEYYMFPILDPAYAYASDSRSYEPIPHLEAGEGYWVLADTDSIIHYTDVVPVESLDIELVPGWNLIGGLNMSLPMSYFTDLPAVAGPCYEYDPATGSYFESDTLRPQKGYWILSTDSVTVHLP